MSKIGTRNHPDWDWPQYEARIAELELANHDLEFHVAVLERTLNNSAEALADNAANGRVLKQALRLACETLYNEGIWFKPGGEQVKNWQGWRAAFIERAQQEMKEGGSR